MTAKSPRPNYERQTLQGWPESIHSIRFLKASKGYDVILYSQTTIPPVESDRNDKTSGVSTLPHVSTSILKKSFFASLHCLAYIDISTKMAMQHMLSRGQLSLLKFWLSQKGPVMKTSLRIWQKSTRSYRLWSVKNLKNPNRDRNRSLNR